MKECLTLPQVALHQRRQYRKQRIEHETPVKRRKTVKVKREKAQQLQIKTPGKRIERLSKLKQHTANVFQDARNTREKN